MDCEQIKEILPAYIQHCASEEEALKVEEHLCICHSCRQYLSQHMDSPQKTPLSTAETSTTEEKQSHLWDYIVLAIGAGIGIFFLLLILK